MGRIATLFVMAFALIAAEPASAHDVRAFADRAEVLKSEALSRAETPGDTTAFTGEVEGFISEARSLANALQAHGAPTDLPCIFRGMAEDAENRLNEMEGGETDAEQYAALGELFDQAHQIASEPETEGYIPLPCEADHA